MPTITNAASLVSIVSGAYRRNGPTPKMFRTNTTNRPPTNPYFPTFLLPSIKIPFIRRRQSSATATSPAEDITDVPSLSSSPTTTTSADDFPVSPTDDATVETYEYDAQDGKIPFPPAAKQPKQRPMSLGRDPRLARTLPDVLRCNTCGTDVAFGLQIVSKGFTGRHGRALLVSAPLATSTPSCPASPLVSNNNTTNHGLGSNVSPGHHALAQESANLVNIIVGRPEPRNLVTGAHVVADINCATCGVKIGWKYVDAREQAQKYKVGKFILEVERVVLLRTWEDISADQSDDLSRHFYSASAPVGSPGSRDRRRSSAFFGGRKSSYSSEGPNQVEDAEEEKSSGSETEEEIAFDSEDEDECEDIFAGTWDAATVARRRNSRVSAGSHQNSKNKSRGGKSGR